MVAFLYFSFFITEVSNIIAETNDNFSQDHFELLNFFLAQKSSVVSAIKSDTSVMKKENYKKASNEGRPLKLSIFELESSLIAQNDREKNRHWFLQ